MHDVYTWVQVFLSVLAVIFLVSELHCICGKCSPAAYWRTFQTTTKIRFFQAQGSDVVVLGTRNAGYGLNALPLHEGDGVVGHH